MKRRKRYEKGFWRLFKNIKTSRSKKLEIMLSELGKRFFKAPASTKYHNSFRGGLLIHSVSTTEILLKLLEAVREEISVRELESYTLVGLFHDLGKIGSKNKNLYLEAETWQKNKGQNYVWNTDLSNLSHPVRSLYLLSQYYIPLTEDEYHSIMYHQGAYTSSGKDIRFHFSEMCLLLHFADVYSAFTGEK